MHTLDHNELHRSMVQWRHHLHATPEFGFEESGTAAFVARTLRGFGFDAVVEGVGGTGVVATLRRGRGSRSIALRADMDALRIHERANHVHRSQHDGLMHACGHDGHTAMLLGAAKLLASEEGFDGTVRFVFQPGEEWGQGALAMLQDDLLERFPFEEIYGVHNWPGLPVGHFATTPGPMMSAEDNFEIVLQGRGGHASRPHVGHEVMVAACATVLNLQSIVSRRLDPSDVAVVSVTELRSDGTRNALPGEARILGDTRSFRPDVSNSIETELRRIAEGTAAAYGCQASVAYSREFIPLVNTAEATDVALAAAREIFPAGVTGTFPPVTVSEDFAQFLRHVPGCFGLIGNGTSSMPLHNARYDFDDASLLLGARYFAAIARNRLSQA
jgi:amidohydrolase